MLTVHLDICCNETNLMHYSSSVYSVTIPLNVSGMLVAHYHEVAMCICDNWYALYVLVDRRGAWFEWNSKMQPPDKGLPKKKPPLQTLTGPEGSSRLRLPDFKTIGT
jgi:hypothetical protein